MEVDNRQQQAVIKSLCHQASNRNSVDKQTRTSSEIKTKVTSKRWIILILFCLNSGNKAFQWIQVPAATTKASSYYQVDNYVINFASIIFMLAFLIMSWPACFIIDKIGIRNAVVTASLGASLGSVIKCFSCHLSTSASETGLVWLLLIGQTLVSLSEQLIFSVPSRLISVWFPDHQVSLAMAFCILGNQLGIALGFIIPQWFLNEAETVAEIGFGFQQVFFYTAILSLTLLVLNYLLFDEAPLHPPGKARLKQLELERVRCEQLANDDSVGSKMRTMFKQVLRLCRNKDLMLVATAYGIAFGRGDTISTLMDQTMLPIYPDNGLIVGITGSLIILAGALGLPVWGRILDEWHAYKKVIVILSLGSALSLICLAYATIHLQHVAVIYSAAILFGFFQTGFMVAGLELAIELTYPEPELITASLLNIMPSFCGPVFILIGSFIVDKTGPLPIYFFYLLTTFAGLCCILCTSEKLNRQEARQAERHEMGQVHVDIDKLKIQTASGSVISSLETSQNL